MQHDSVPGVNIENKRQEVVLALPTERTEGVLEPIIR